MIKDHADHAKMLLDNSQPLEGVASRIRKFSFATSAETRAAVSDPRSRWQDFMESRWRPLDGFGFFFGPSSPNSMWGLWSEYVISDVWLQEGWDPDLASRDPPPPPKQISPSPHSHTLLT